MAGAVISELERIRKEAAATARQRPLPHDAADALALPLPCQR
jgi:hypothetical protein